MDTDQESTCLKPEAAETGLMSNQKTISACAKACNIDPRLIECIYPAHPEQEHRMNHHIHNGTYFEQMVLQFDHMASVQQQKFLIKVIDTIRIKNYILRTRLVKRENTVYEVVLKERSPWTTEDYLKGYFRKNINVRMGYGSELCRYALLGDEHGETFFIWTGMTSRSIFDDLQQACSDLRSFSNMNLRMQYSEYVAWTRSCNLASALHFWRSRYSFFKQLDFEFPNFGPPKFSTMSDAQALHTLHFPMQENRPNISLSVIGHAAWALTVYEECGSSDVDFISMSPGIERIMGPVSARVPIRITFDKDMTTGGLLKIIGYQLLSMVGVEHYAVRALRGQGFNWKSVTQGVFQWHPLRSDVFNKMIVCHDKDAALATLRFRQDLSTPANHDYGLMVDIWEEDGYISINTSWNSQLLEWRKVDHLIKRFTTLFTLIVNGHGETVGELIGHCNGVEGEATGFTTSLSTLRHSSTEFEGFSN
ncbi:hypothetical protein OEA41_007322 [Lepraria neglecta]|uniref:Uncharacterized protein n=1 Tax=Lepraria neglecta TaxID=209136 RepID=A0AAD9ZDE1_9LECA|nr:hypothetical protein OEA41_007322 [Lepraria neglecta]